MKIKHAIFSKPLLISLIVSLITFSAIYSISTFFSYNPKDFYFTNAELAHIASYKIGDTICFENQLGDLDTLTIKNIQNEPNKQFGTFMARPADNYIAVSIEHISFDKTVRAIKNKNGRIEHNYQQIISIDKLPQTKEIKYSINFKDFNSNISNKGIGEFHSDTITINDKKITQYYIIRAEHPERITDPMNIEILYWTDKDGLTAYKNKNGDWWTKN